MTEEYIYELICGVCESEVTCIVVGDEELPGFCPMCGSDQSMEWTGPLYN